MDVSAIIDSIQLETGTKVTFYGITGFNKESFHTYDFINVFAIYFHGIYT